MGAFASSGEWSCYWRVIFRVTSGRSFPLSLFFRRSSRCMGAPFLFSFPSPFSFPFPSFFPSLSLTLWSRKLPFHLYYISQALVDFFSLSLSLPPPFVLYLPLSIFPPIFGSFLLYVYKQLATVCNLITLYDNIGRIGMAWVGWFLHNTFFYSFLSLSCEVCTDKCGTVL